MLSQMPSMSSSLAQSRRRRPKHQAGSHRSHSRSPGCPHTRIRRWPRDRCRCRTHRRRQRSRHIVTDAIGILAVHSPPHTPRRRADCRRSRSPCQVCLRIHIRRSRRDRCRCRTHRIHQCSRQRRHRRHRHRHLPRSHHYRCRGRRASCRRSRRLRQDVSTATFIESLRSRCTHRTRRTHQHNRPRHRRCRLSSSASQSPPHTPKASSWFPSQSQSPSRMSVHPHS